MSILLLTAKLNGRCSSILYKSFYEFASLTFKPLNPLFVYKSLLSLVNGTKDGTKDGTTFGTIYMFQVIINDKFILG